MIITNEYIPKEYLALKINYCRQQLGMLPNIQVQKNDDPDSPMNRVIVNGHRYRVTSKNGLYYSELLKKREYFERQLQVCQTIWYNNFKGEPSKDCVALKVNRIIYVDTDKPIIMNKEYFDSLENDADYSYPKPDNYQFNGIKYRSAAEREIAIFYTEMGIPFKYEPKVMLKGLVKAIHPDFVTYFEELDTCKFHEHFGMKNYADYCKTSKIKFSNFANAGLVQDLDIIFTNSTDNTSFDPRHLSAKLNAAIYGTICMSKPLTDFHFQHIE